jgi:hypothetical protein
VLEAAQTAGAAPERLVLPVRRGATYYLAIDGFAGAQTGYRLEAQCELIP